MKSRGRETHGNCRFQQVAARCFRKFLQPQRGVGHAKQYPAYTAPQISVNLPQLIECRHDGRTGQLERQTHTQTANTSSSYLLLTACVRLGFEADFQRMCSLTTDITANNSDIEFRLHQLTVLLSISDGCVNSCCLPQQTY